MKDHSSGEAAKHRNRFTLAALLIVVTHLLATVLATLVLVLHGAHCPEKPNVAANEQSEAATPVVQDGNVVSKSVPDWPLRVLLSLLVVELLALIMGLWTHHQLNHSAAHSAHSGPHPMHPGGMSHAWALARLLAEINRSVSSLDNLHIYLEYLFQIPLPIRLRHLLRTINVLHLATTSGSTRPWKELRDAYVAQRLDGQRHYFQGRGNRAGTYLIWATVGFVILSGAAIIVTAFKLSVLWEAWLPPFDSKNAELTGTLGFFAIVLPAVAVGVMSLAAAYDLKARNHIYREMAQWLAEQKDSLQQAASRQEFQQLAQETESRLLGETAEWYSRRSFTGVA